MADFSLGHWVIVGFLVWIGYRILVRRAEARAPKSTDTWRFDVVGESFYRANFETLFPRRKHDAGSEVECTATLRLDDDNAHDDQAVAVLIRSLQVGHLSRANARRYRQAKGASRANATVDAVVWIPDDAEKNYSVSVYLRL